MAPPRKWYPVDKVCPACRKTWRAVTSYQIQKQEFCSRKCRTVVHGNGRGIEKIKRDCKQCGKPIEALPCQSKTKWFCSHSCSSTYNNQGAQNPAWKGGDAQGKYWKREARRRDDFTCQFPDCGKVAKNKVMHAHHKIPRGAGGADTLDNLITLCSQHHREMERRLLAGLIDQCPDAVRGVASQLYSW